MTTGICTDCKMHIKKTEREDYPTTDPITDKKEWFGIYIDSLLRVGITRWIWGPNEVIVASILRLFLKYKIYEIGREVKNSLFTWEFAAIQKGNLVLHHF